MTEFALHFESRNGCSNFPAWQNGSLNLVLALFEGWVATWISFREGGEYALP